MPHFVIDYRLEGRRPGYAFTTDTDGFDEQVVKNVWRDAMPRGQGWGSERYVGARSLKCFRVERRIMAFSEVTVTDRADEEGRRGIRRSVITLVPIWHYRDTLIDRLGAMPDNKHDAAERKLTLGRWMRIIERLLPKLRRSQSQIVLAYPYENPAQWEIVEALVLSLATSWNLRTFWGTTVSITTLALTHRSESRIVAIPAEHARRIRSVPVIDLS